LSAHFAPDDKKIAYQDNGGNIFVYFLDDFLSDIRKRKGDVINISTSYELLNHFEWYNDSFHFFAQSGDKLIFSEIDDRPPRNTYSLAENVQQYIYDGSTHILYILEEGNLSSAEFEF